MSVKKEALGTGEQNWDDIEKRAQHVASISTNRGLPAPEISTRVKTVLKDGLKLDPQDIRRDGIDPFYAWTMVYDALACKPGDDFGMRLLGAILKNIASQEETSVSQS